MAAPSRVDRFTRWLADAAPETGYIYHRGELARDRVVDQALDALAAAVLRQADGRFDVVSKCEHVRGEIIGAAKIRMTTMRMQGETVYLAIKR